MGAGVFQLLEEHAVLVSDRTQRPIVVTAVSARAKGKNRGINLSKVRWHDNPVDLAGDEDVDVVVELMGGSSGAAFDLIKKALENNKPVVTANKALLALRGGEILGLLGKSKGTISYEAAVAGGIPIIKGLREGLAANKIRAVYGIPYSFQHIARLEKSGLFPKRMQLGPNRVAWYCKEIEDWIAVRAGRRTD